MTFAQIHALRIILVEMCVLGAALLLARLVMMRWLPIINPPAWLAWVLARDGRAVLLVIVAALLGRACLLPVLGIPEPRNSNEYSYWLLADTFAHHRLTNPTPAAWQHFETLHTNVQPTYHSKFPVSQGLVLAFGEILFHQPWVGVYLSTALLCGAICWTLQAFLPPGWALLGGLFAVFRLALFSYWMNSYFGGSAAAIGGAVALGTIVRLFDPDASDRKRMFLAAAFAISLLILATSRPYEGFAYSIPLLAYACYQTALTRRLPRKQLLAPILTIVTIGLVGILLLGYYNRRTTGSALLMPYILTERTYSPLPLFLWQKPNTDLVFRDPIFVQYYRKLDPEYQQMQSLRGLGHVEFKRLLLNWFFYVGPALSVPVLLGILLSLKDPRLRLALFAVLSMGIAHFLSVHSTQHYLAPATVVVYLFAVEGLHYLWDQRGSWERAFVVAVGLTVMVVSLTAQTGSAAMFTKYAVPDVQQLAALRLKNEPGKHLVLLTYLDGHNPENELAQNLADFSSEKILWARSKGTGNDVDLCQAYPDRDFWSLKTDDTVFTLNAVDLCKLPNQ